MRDRNQRSRCWPNAKRAQYQLGTDNRRFQESGTRTSTVAQLPTRVLPPYRGQGRSTPEANHRLLAGDALDRVQFASDAHRHVALFVT